jgi:3-oxoacyl-ACP reductase-like protein
VQAIAGQGEQDVYSRVDLAKIFHGASAATPAEPAAAPEAASPATAPAEPAGSPVDVEATVDALVAHSPESSIGGIRSSI